MKKKEMTELKSKTKKELIKMVNAKKLELLRLQVKYMLEKRKTLKRQKI
jgi:ribosomal protein L29